MRREGRSCRGLLDGMAGLEFTGGGALCLFCESVLSGCYRDVSTEVVFEFFAEQMRCLCLASHVTCIQFYRVSFKNYAGHYRIASG